MARRWIANSAGSGSVILSASVTTDVVDVELDGSHAFWMYTVTGGDPVEVHYTHS